VGQEAKRANLFLSVTLSKSAHFNALLDLEMNDMCRPTVLSVLYMIHQNIFESVSVIWCSSK